MAFSEKELEGNVAAQRPCFFIVMCAGKCEIQQLQAFPVTTAQKQSAHIASDLIVVLWPAAVEVDSQFPCCFRGYALQQIVPPAECARQTGRQAKHSGPSPGQIQ